ncbi:MAG: hypothetical protein HY059_09695 [Proteobacteria bacterium]|nr:hypothetical protein [Pseudomonadota bacterium]
MRHLFVAAILTAQAGTCFAETGIIDRLRQRTARTPSAVVGIPEDSFHMRLLRRSDIVLKDPTFEQVGRDFPYQQALWKPNGDYVGLLHLSRAEFGAGDVNSVVNQKLSKLLSDGNGVQYGDPQTLPRQARAETIRLLQESGMVYNPLTRQLSVPGKDGVRERNTPLKAVYNVTKNENGSYTITTDNDGWPGPRQYTVKDPNSRCAFTNERQARSQTGDRCG